MESFLGEKIMLAFPCAHKNGLIFFFFTTLTENVCHELKCFNCKQLISGSESGIGIRKIFFKFLLIKITTLYFRNSNIDYSVCYSYF